jgi:3-oxoacyl-[acyl-carrier protein] reductase
MMQNNNSSARRVAVLQAHLAPAPLVGPSLIPGLVTGTVHKPLLDGQVAIITGSGQGIGEAAAYLFADNGAKLVITDLDKAKSDHVADTIKAKGGQAISVPGDVTDPSFPDYLMKQTIEAFGRLDIIVNNAGYTWDGVIHRMTDKQWEAMLLVHNTAPFRIIRAASPYMRDAAKEEIEKTGKASPRCIINISSTSGIHGNAGQINYATAKMGVVGLTKTVAKEWGMFNIRCNAIAFGWINTRLTAAKEKDNVIVVDNQKIQLGIPGGGRGGGPDATAHIPLRRAGQVDDAAGSILLLASPHASYITGHCLEVTGGVGI